MKKEVDVLLLDDDKDICMMVEAILQFAGFKVEACTSPDQLPQLLTSCSPRLLLMDMLLSGTDGRHVCRKLKSDPVTSHIKIIMMSAHPDAEKTCREAGTDDFIAKPFDMENFIGRIKKLLPTYNQ
jgi:DNA-binding response OmpR family regulator